MGGTAQTVASVLRGSLSDFSTYSPNPLSCRSSSLSPPLSPAPSDRSNTSQSSAQSAPRRSPPVPARTISDLSQTTESEQPPKSVTSSRKSVDSLTTAPMSQPALPAAEIDTHWLDPAITAILSCTDTPRNSDGLNVLSQALPVPSSKGHAYSHIIKTVRARTRVNQFTWISLLHAIPRRTLIADMPQSPSNNQMYLIDSKDFLGCRVYDSAVPAIDYETCSPEEVAAHGRALAPPATINLSIVERVIPPTSSNEVRDMFDPQGSSLLIDRMTELSRENGCLTFIYPTKTGARTFASEYLSPVLDPALRSNIIMHNLSRDLGQELGPMHSVEQLYEFEEMRSRIIELFRALSDTLSGVEMLAPDSDAVNAGARMGSSRRSLSISSNFSLIHATKTNVTLDKSVWVDWWVQQEHPRLANSIMKYYRDSSRLHPEVSQAGLLQGILDGVRQRAAAQSCAEPIEVAVFVIRRER